MLEHLRVIQADVSDVKVRMTSLEENMAADGTGASTSMDRRMRGHARSGVELVETYASKSAWNQFPEAY